MKRRTLLSMAAAGALASLGPAWAAKKPVPLKILILGGTRFIGLHMTALALARGHTLTFFNRDKTKTDRYRDVERIKGDRNGQIDGLKGREWDVVIDNSGYVPRHVRLSAELLAPKVKQYVFTSSISVYPNFSAPRDESSPVGKLADETVEKVDGETYGPLKALCEQAVLSAMPGRTTIIRPGLRTSPTASTASSNRRRRKRNATRVPIPLISVPYRLHSESAFNTKVACVSLVGAAGAVVEPPQPALTTTATKSVAR